MDFIILTFQSLYMNFCASIQTSNIAFDSSKIKQTVKYQKPMI